MEERELNERNRAGADVESAVDAMIRYLKEKHKESWVAKKDMYWRIWANGILAERDPRRHARMKSSHVPPIALLSFFESPSDIGNAERFLSNQRAANMVARRSIQSAIQTLERAQSEIRNGIDVLKAYGNCLESSEIATENALSVQHASNVTDQVDIDY